MKKAKLETVVNNSYKETVTIKDKEILFELAKKNKTEGKKFINFLLELGINVWKFSSSEIDHQRISEQREILISSIEKAAKETEQMLDSYATDLLKGQNGKVARAFTREQEKLTRQVKSLINPNDSTSVPSQIEKTVDTTVSKITKEFLKEIKKLNDASDVDSPISKIKDQTIQAIVGPVNELVEEVTGIVDVLKTHSLVKEESEKGTQKGLVYEKLVSEKLHELSNISGDYLEEVGAVEGTSKTGKGKKKGDQVLVVSDSDGTSARIVFEVKDLAKKQSVNQVIKLLDQSCENRQASIGVYVASSIESAPVRTNFTRIAPGRYSVVFDKTNLDMLALEICFQSAKLEALSLTRSKLVSESEIDFEKVGIHLKELRELVDVITAIKQNISRAESGMSDAQNNISTLQVSLSKNLEGLDTALSS